MADSRRSSGPAHAAAAAGALVAVGIGIIVAVDGSPFWRAVRVVVVVGCCAVVALGPINRVRAVDLTALGVTATAIGGTIAFSYLTTTGLTAKSGGGILAAAGGIVALAIGTTRLVRAAHGWYRMLAIPIAAVVAYGFAVPLGTAVYATNVPRPALGSVTPTDRGLRYQDASFVTSDGVTLSGWYLPSSNRAAVVLLHGASSTRSNVLDHAVVLARHGYGVLLFDARGHGLSTGRAMDFGWYGDRDVAAAVEYLQHRPDVDPRRIGAVGMSMGGEEVVGAMAYDTRVRAVVAEGATNRTFADKTWLPAAYGLRGRIQQGVDWLTFGLTDLLTAADPPVALRRAVAIAAPRPVLLIAAGTVADEEKADDAIRTGSPSTVEVRVVPGAGHTGGLQAQPHEWELRVTTFLGNALLGARKTG